MIKPKSTSEHFTSNNGFTLLELLIVIVLIGLMVRWGLPTIQRQLVRQEVKNYAIRVASGLQSLRARQSIMKTSCTMQFPSDAITPLGSNSPTNFVAPEGLIELSGLETSQRSVRLNCSDDAEINQTFRLIDTENSPLTQKVDISVSRSTFTISPPGTAIDGGSLIILVRSKRHGSINPPLPVRCVEFTGNGLSRIGNWETGACETL